MEPDELHGPAGRHFRTGLWEGAFIALSLPVKWRCDSVSSILRVKNGRS